MPGVKVVGDPHTKGSLQCVGPRRCKSCGGAVFHQLVEDDPTGGGKLWRRQLESAGRALRGSIGYTFEGPVAVDATFVLARPASAQKRLWPHVKPDLDKLTRMLLDALTSAQVIRDDALVCELNVRKQYPGMIPELSGAGVVVRLDLMVDPDALPIEGGM